MTASPPPSTPKPGSAQPGTPAPRRHRDAAGTRRLLLDAARRRFAENGYAATTVRQITDDAGVNVALINRYFASKEGLLTACLTESVDELRQTTCDGSIDTLPDTIAGHITGSSAAQSLYEHLLLLLRPFGDERADHIRLGVLSTYSERVASQAGLRPDVLDSDPLLLRAQVILSAAMGILLLRSSGLQPIASASEQTLVAPLRDLVTAMLSPR